MQWDTCLDKLPTQTKIGIRSDFVTIGSPGRTVPRWKQEKYSLVFGCLWQRVVLQKMLVRDSARVRTPKSTRCRQSCRPEKAMRWLSPARISCDRSATLGEISRPV